ncbi:presenilin family intramembrane aspartyl protease PSH [Halapricum hydrolyticum]|uniref:Presenilin family intramembrane aspartyl protease n=1 Tax=Halapricum hydrolyticum TaxID=2979991 RepID=A0AAE3LFB6_9EURY|nr:presenilin family intramembrane aspartyl protease PSH [Halapricum hydrolyticum]MCU4718495.1 presenilin family intramembrane aspartyl protease [Halapricum hydrolyticum]MCU4727486.1 presenilin family intramembrane aspartyl protease [Halapricum hydrolyticum]
MEQRTRAAVAALGIAAIFLLVQLGALALVEPFEQAGLQATENPQNATNSVIYVGALLVMTGFMLLAFKYDLDVVIRGLVVFVGGYIGFIVLASIVPASVVPVAGASALAWAAAGAIVLGLLVHPEWYVIDAAGIVMGAGAAGLFGISFGVLPALLLLGALAVYDAISVYGTEHMLTLAEGVMDLRIPVVLVVPLTLSYSFLEADAPDSVSEADATDSITEADGSGEGGENPEDRPDSDGESDREETDGESDAESSEEALDREALFIGLGDAVIPTVLVASAAAFAPEAVPDVVAGGLAIPATAAGAMVGTFVGLAILLRMVLRGRAHAGLPLLNGGAIAGYLLAAVASGLSLAQAIGLAGV